MQTDAEVESFLRDAGWGDVPRIPLMAGFSSRQFYRLTRAKGEPRTAILMRASADQKTESFVNLSALLRRIELPAPAVFASDLVRDIVLMEDFGDNQLGLLMDQGKAPQGMDEAAMRFLADLHKRFAQSMLGAYKTPLYNAALLTDQATLFLEYYYPRLFRRAATARERSGFVEAWQSVLSPLDGGSPRSLLLRDFIPDNMMALEKPLFKHPFGAIDFQDAGLGSIAYDIASWCEEVRRDGRIARLPDMVRYYCTLNPAMDEAALLMAAQIYAAQRHTRILGLLVKLDKTEMIPRVWRTLQSLLKFEPLAPVRRWFLACPPPQAAPVQAASHESAK